MDTSQLQRGCVATGGGKEVDVSPKSKEPFDGVAVVSCLGLATKRRDGRPTCANMSVQTLKLEEMVRD
jgi:hypothetical protein